MAAMTLGSAGLLLDILGVVMLYVATSTEKIEAELSYKIMRDLTPGKGEEWVFPYSFQEHEDRLERARYLVITNRRRGRCAVVLVGVGFLLQGIAAWV